LVLQKIYKNFYKVETSRKQGTLAFFKGRLQRTNVNGQVKTAYEANKDFACMIAR
jgi:hypothetical protein